MEPLIRLVTTPPPFAILDRVLDGPYFDVTGGELPVAVQLGRTESGQLVCTGVLVGWGTEPKRVTARALQHIHLGELLGSLSATLEVDAPTVEPKRAGPKGWPDSHYRRVAELYERGLEEAPRRPVRWLCGELNASQATVHRWLQRARDKGMLPRTGRRGPG